MKEATNTVYNYTIIVLTNTTGTCHALTMDYYVLL